MADERHKILEMLGEGKINVEEAERLLSAAGADAGPHSGDPSPGGTKRHLRVTVNSGKGEAINVRIPFQLIRAGVKLRSFVGLLPAEVQDRIKEKLGDAGLDVDPAKADAETIEQIINGLGELEVSIAGTDGDQVRVFAE